MCVYLQVGRQRMRALIDYGARRSLLHLDAWRDYCMETGRDTRLCKIPKGITLRSLSKQEIPTKGLAVVNVYGVDVQFYVVSLLSHDLLLGDGALRLLKASIDYDNNVVKLAGKRHKSLVAGLRDAHLASVHLEIDRWVTKFPELFAKSKKLNKTESLKIEIDTGWERPFHIKAYHMPLRKRQIVDREIDRMLEEDIIEPSESPWASPITLVPKPGVKFAFVLTTDVWILSVSAIRTLYPP